MSEEKKLRRICIYCGRKRNLDQLEFVRTSHGIYYQAGKEIDIYRCRPVWGKYCDGTKATGS